MTHADEIPDAIIRACLADSYCVTADTLNRLKLGLDTTASVFRVVSESGEAHFLKVRSGPIYEPAYDVPAYLGHLGIEAVVAPLRTNRRALWAAAANRTLSLYPFVEGDSNKTGMTVAQWRAAGAVLRRVHETPLPPSGFASLRRETFDPSLYVSQIGELETSVEKPASDAAASHDALRTAWKAHRPEIHEALMAMERLAGALRAGRLPFVVCHADLHPANLIRTGDARVCVVDWDDVMLAPKERDFIFVDVPKAREVATPFCLGYGDAEIDWTALTYYRYERSVQDLIARARSVLGHDLDDQSKALAVEHFLEVLAPEGKLDAARTDAARLRRR